jgi:dolichyl-phosphate-mannose-protein mannosyltransferase
MQTKALEKLQRFASERKGQIVLVILILAVSLIVRLLLFHYHGYSADEGTFKSWYDTAAKNGLYGFYDAVSWCDYPPFSIYIFWIFGNLSHAIGPDSLDVLIKLPQNLFDLATACLIFCFLRPRYSFKLSLGVMAVYAFNPATIFDLAVWGQFDSIYAFFILTKPQSVVLLPILAYVILRNGRWKRAISSGVVCIALVFLLIVPFHWSNPITFLIDHYSGYSVYQYNSINAYNLWSLIGFWKADSIKFLGLSYQIWGIVAFVVFFCFVMWQLHRKYEQKAAIFAVFLLMFGFFMFMTRIHERYLFPVFALLAMSWSGHFTFRRVTTWIYLGLTGTYLANLVYVMSKLNAGTFIPDGHWSLYVLAPINIILFILSICVFYRMQRNKPVTEVLK